MKQLDSFISSSLSISSAFTATGAWIKTLCRGECCHNIAFQALVIKKRGRFGFGVGTSGECPSLLPHRDYEHSERPTLCVLAALYVASM